MKKSTLFLILIFISFSFSFSQNSTISKGKKFYNFYDYFKAIEKYEPLTDKTPEIKRELALSYFNTGQYPEAEKYFSQICKSDDATNDDIYDYVKVLLINEKYKEAEKWMNEFSKRVPNDTRAKLFASSKGFYNNLSKDKGYFAIKDLDFNNKDQEFATVFYKNKVIFTSSRHDVEIIKRKWAWNQLPFLDLYIATIDTNTLEFLSFEKFNFNKKFHEGTVSFDKKGDFMFFTSNNYKHPSSDGIIKLEMFSTSIKKNGKWKKTIPFEYNSKEYSVGHPSLTPDGKTLYFASDMPGGIGGVDIYKTHLINGHWSKPENLGNKINTEGNEMFPFYNNSGYLFFASDGRPGLGGLDVFVAKIKNGKYFNVENMGTPINTNFDDFAFIIDENLKYGYFSSNRISGKGDDDIYSFKLLVPYFTKKTITGVVYDTNNIYTKKIDNATVSLFDNNNKLIKTITTDTSGKYKFIVETDKDFLISGTKIKYTKDTKQLSTKGSEPIINQNLFLNKMKFTLVGVIADDKTKKPIDSVTVLIVKTKKAIKYNFITDINGHFRKELNDISIYDTVNYSINVTKYGYLPFSKDFKIIYDHPGEYNINEYLKIKLHKIKIGDDIGKIVNINPIYFDLNKYNIRLDAAIELDKIVKVMKENPTMTIELGAHTDSRGSYSYNRTLSAHRAASSAKYIQDRIDNPKRIYGKGYGESTPLIVTTEINAQFPFLPVGQKLDESFIYSLPKKDQQEAAHQLNRRTEFKIIKF